MVEPIEFTQFMRPNGRKVQVLISRPSSVAEAARSIVSSGARFEIEELMTGAISMTCEIDDAEEEVIVLAHELCPNGPKVPEAVDRLVQTASEALAKQQS